MHTEDAADHVDLQEAQNDPEDGAKDGGQNGSAPMPFSEELGVAERMVVDRENAVSNLLRARLGVWDWTLAMGEEVFRMSKLRRKCGENDKLTEERAWVLIIMSPAIRSV
ncbi:hypothetical protein PILCRDRAFT_93027 [Piloderma croceum F 1598]|uniref:Uncharacterized protein n=1 Tax=Piloderma croceum (strain F 1598) TaxID=765440 RepID=A0A0C3F042_PILCF|nr:hypothetical protein PILCRDRAFT_93027 [Piloderma croceum F 1598]